MFQKTLTLLIIIVFSVAAFASDKIIMPQTIEITGEDRELDTKWGVTCDVPPPPPYHATDDTLGETFGSWSTVYTGTARDRGNIFGVTTTVNLYSHSLQLDAAGVTDAVMFIYQGTAPTGTFNMVDTVYIQGGPGMVWFDSGERNYELQAGSYYYIGCSWNQSCGYSRGGANGPYPCSFGTMQTGIPGSMLGAYPPNPSGSTTYTGYSAYVAYLVTGHLAPAGAPAAVSNFTVNHNNLVLQASLAWTNPTMTFGGDTLTDLTGVKVFRDAVQIADLTPAVIGAPMTYEDTTVTVAGEYEYTVKPYNTAGDGEPSSQTAWIGLDTPGEPGNVTATPDTGGTLVCEITWTAPTAGGHGGYWPAGSWDGLVIFRNGVALDSLTGAVTTYVDSPAVANWYTYGVGYYNATGTGTVGEAPSVYVGSIPSGSFDVGGGTMHFTTIVDAAASINGTGIGGAVIFNVYPGTYDGQILLDNIPGLSATNTVTFHGIHGPVDQMPIVTNLTGTGTYEGNGFLLQGVTYITIEGFEFQQCAYTGIHIDDHPTTSDSSSHITVKGNYFNHCYYNYYSYNSRHLTITGNEFNSSTSGSYAMRVRYTTDSEFSNNMVYGGTSNGIYTYNTARCDWMYNSWYNSAGTRTFYLGGSSSMGHTFKNNIFVNAGTGIAAYYYTGTNPISDYNCFWAPTGNVGYYGSNAQTLAQFQALTGQDSNSIEADPLFVSTTDLTSPTPACVGAGTPIAGITDDFDGEQKIPNTPCIGCDEIAGGLRVTVNPVNPPIVIPAGGGMFQFDVILENASDSAITFDAWTEVILPNGSVFGPLVQRNGLVINPAQTIQRLGINQNVPGNAPPGTYTYVGNAGTYPGTILGTDCFTFDKQAGDNTPNHNQGWAVYGFFDEFAEGTASTPTEYSLANAYPNPFNPSTHISFALPEAVDVKLVIFDVTGREVATLIDGWMNSGYHKAVFEGSNLSSGIYFYKLTAGSFNETKKMVLVK